MKFKKINLSENYSQNTVVSIHTIRHQIYQIMYHIIEHHQKKICHLSGIN